jgi:hypothetical protein
MRFTVFANFLLFGYSSAYTLWSYTNESDPYYGQSPAVYPSRTLSFNCETRKLTRQSELKWDYQLKVGSSLCSSS